MTTEQLLHSRHVLSVERWDVTEDGRIVPPPSGSSASLALLFLPSRGGVYSPLLNLGIPVCCFG